MAVQALLYLTLRRIAVATLPAWAHGHVHHRAAAPPPVSDVVGVTVVRGAGTAPDMPGPHMPGPPALPAPTLETVPLVPLPPPALVR